VKPPLDVFVDGVAEAPNENVDFFSLSDDDAVGAVPGPNEKEGLGASAEFPEALAAGVVGAAGANEKGDLFSPGFCAAPNGEAVLVLDPAPNENPDGVAVVEVPGVLGVDEPKPPNADLGAAVLDGAGVDDGVDELPKALEPKADCVEVVIEGADGSPKPNTDLLAS